MPKQPSLKQRKVAKKIVQAMNSTDTPTAGQILEDVGYAPGIVKNPQAIMRSPGVQKALEELGFSVDAADTVVAEILTAGFEPNRLKAADMIYKRLGAYVKETDPPPPSNTYNFILNPQIKVAVLEFEKQVKQLITSDVQKENDTSGSGSGSPSGNPSTSGTSAPGSN